MTEFNRREVLELFTAGAVGAALSATPAEAKQAQEARGAQGREAAGNYTPAFFTAHEYATVSLLADTIIPPDERSGGAVEAGVPEFIDFTMTDQPERQIAMRGGLAWLDVECLKRFDRSFVDCPPEQRTALLDEIALIDPARAEPPLSHGAAFFAAFRDLTATGFWTSKTGIGDLQYQGNTFVGDWHGCPQEVLRRLGLAVLFLAAVLTASTLRAAPAGHSQSSAPKDTGAAVDASALYAKHCRACHADGNSPIAQMNFANGEWKHGSRLEDIVKVVRGGAPGTAMLGFRDKLTEPEIRALAKHVRAFDTSLKPEPEREPRD